jgi:hypothetical protein
MLARFVLGALVAGASIVPAVAGKIFSCTCFDGTRGAGRILDDMGAAGSIQFGGSGPIRNVRLPGNTLQIRGQAVCASLRGIPFEPCFNLDRRDEVSFRGSVSGMGFAYCDFHNQGGTQMLMARAVAHPRSRRPVEQTGSVEVSSRVETPAVESAKLEPISSEPKPAPAKSEPALELRHSTD